MARYPALDVHIVDPGLVLAAVDDFAPTAVEDREDAVRVFFTRAADRDAARTAVLAEYPAARVDDVDVDDEDWARRSQADLRPVTVGRVTIVPELVPDPEPRAPSRGSVQIVIRPSMGFGTGHHATTRLCVAALQTLDLHGRSVLDVGTGSGILAIVASRLGAASAIAVDNDPDAIQAARENLALNPDVQEVALATGDIREIDLAPADVVTANLTGTLLTGAAPILKSSVTIGGHLIVSGLLADEEPAVVRAIEPFRVVWRGAEEEWVALVANHPGGDLV